MKKLILLLLLVPFVIQAQDYTVLTFNIRYDNGNDGEDNWVNRKAGVVSILKSNNVDIIGLQEVLHNQLLYLDSALTGYTHVGVGRDNGKTKGEYSPIYYKTDKFTLLNKGWFWLSEKPNKPTMGWDAVCKRICTWVVLRDTITHKQFYVFNTHFDHKGKNAQKQSAIMLYGKINELQKKGYGAILTGDLNSRPESDAIRTLLSNGLLNDAKTTTQTPAEGTNGTANSFHLEEPYPNRIDYILSTTQFTVNKYKVINDRLPNGHWPSDHFPVLAILRLNDDSEKN